MIKIQKCKRYGVCDNCGRKRDANSEMLEIKATLIGQGLTTVMLCKDCFASLNTAIASTVDKFQ